MLLRSIVCAEILQKSYCILISTDNYLLFKHICVKFVYFIEHANIWYTSTGGVQALDTMLTDLEGALLN